MIERRMSLGLSVLMAVVGVGGVLLSLGWRPEVRLMPITIAAVLALLSLVQLALDLRAPAVGEADAAAAAGEEPSASRKQEATGRLGEFKGLFWFLVVSALVLGGGMLVGLPLAIFLTCRFAFGATWRLTALLVAFSCALLWLFTQMFNLFWSAPLLL